MATRKPPEPQNEPPGVGDTLAGLRQAQALSLDELSRKAGVSKSMLSQIERALANPTLAVVWRLANALGVPIAALLGGAPAAPAAPAITLVPTQSTPSLRSPMACASCAFWGRWKWPGSSSGTNCGCSPAACWTHSRTSPAHVNT